MFNLFRLERQKCGQKGRVEQVVFVWKDTAQNPGRQVPIFSYFFLFFSAYSYFSYFLAISSYFSYFLAILLTINKYLLEIWTF